MKKIWLTIDELALELQVSVKSSRRAYRKGQIPVERICRFVRFDLERVKQAMRGNRKGQFPLSTREQGQRSATGGARSRPAPNWVRWGRLSHSVQSMNSINIGSEQEHGAGEGTIGPVKPLLRV